MTLRQLREQAGLTQEQLSEATAGRVGQVTISSLERGKITNPTIGTVQDLARALRVTTDECANAIAASVEEAA